MVSVGGFSGKDDACEAAGWKLSEFPREIATSGAEDRLYSQRVFAAPLHVVARVVADFCRVNCKKSNKNIGLHGLA